MHQIRLFVGVESELRRLESDINAWLAETDAEIVNMFGNIAPQTTHAQAPRETEAGRRFQPSDLFVAVVYKT
jgi:hypothetical protein